MAEKTTPKASARYTVERLSQALKRGGVPHQKEASEGGAFHDLLVDMPDGRRIAVEVKSWPMGSATLARAKRQAARYTNISGVDEAYLVIPGLKKSQPKDHVFNEADLASFLKTNWTAQPAKKAAKRRTSTRKKISARPRAKATTKKSAAKKSSSGGFAKKPARKLRARKKSSTADTPRIFVAMPFKEKYQDTYFVAMIQAAKAVGAACDQVEHATFTGDIVAEIKRMIRKSRLVVADLSEARPNVLFEIGCAHGLGRPVIQISSSPLKTLPFDVRNDKTHPYGLGQTHKLKLLLQKEFRAHLHGNKGKRR